MESGRALTGLMDSQNTAWGILRQLEDSAPQAGDVEITLVKSYYQEVGLLLTEKIHDCFNLSSFDQMTVESDAGTLDLGSCMVLKFCIKIAPVLFQDVRDRAIGNGGKRGIRG